MGTGRDRAFAVALSKRCSSQTGGDERRRREAGYDHPSARSDRARAPSARLHVARQGSRERDARLQDQRPRAETHERGGCGSVPPVASSSRTRHSREAGRRRREGARGVRRGMPRWRHARSVAVVRIALQGAGSHLARHRRRWRTPTETTASPSAAPIESSSEAPVSEATSARVPDRPRDERVPSGREGESTKERDAPVRLRRRSEAMRAPQPDVASDAAARGNPETFFRTPRKNASPPPRERRKITKAVSRATRIS